MSDEEDNGGVSYPAFLMEVECGLDEAQRREVIYTFAQLSRWSHYEALGVGRDDGRAKVQAAFRARVMEWHPDRLPRDLGPFRAMVSGIHKRIEEARRVLSDERLRAEYDGTDKDAMNWGDRRAWERRSPREAKRTQGARDRGAWSREDLVEEVRRLEAESRVHRSEPWIRRGYAYLNRSSFEDADMCFRKALDINPTSLDAVKGLAEFIKVDEELKTVARSCLPLEFDGHNWDVVLAVAIAHVQVGRETEAQAVLKRFGGDNDDNPPPAAALAIA